MHITRQVHNSPQNSSKFWMDLLNSTQLISKNMSCFPQVKACHLRIAYKKLQNSQHPSPSVHAPPGNQLLVTNLQKTKGSFLLDKQLSTIDSNAHGQKAQVQIQPLTLNQYEKLDRKRRPLLPQSTTRYGNPHFVFDSSMELIRTVDVSQIKKLKNAEHSLENARSIPSKKSKQFTDYFKKVILSQKTNNELHRLFSEGKGLDISDRGDFQKLERVKLSIQNRKLEQKQKSFRCVSTKLNKYHIGRKEIGLPSLKNMKKKEESRLGDWSGDAEKGQIQGSGDAKKKVQSFACEPWEIDSHYNNDIQQH